MKRFIGWMAAMALVGCSSTAGNGAKSAGYTPKIVPGPVPGNPAPTPTPAAGPVNVEVFDDLGNPAAGLPVIFNHPDGRVLEQQQTSDSGEASAAIPLNATVTVFRDQPTFHYLQSVTGLHGGMHVVAGGSAAAASPSSISVAMPGAFAGALFYEVDSGCGQGFTQVGTDTVDVALDGSCPVGGSFSLLAIARDSSWAPVAFSFQTGLTVPASSLHVSLGAWRNDFTTVPVALANAPAGSASVSVGIDLWHDGRRFSFGSASAEVAAGGSAGMEIGIPGDFAEATSWSVTLCFDNGTSGSFFERRVAVLPAISMDLTTDLLPRTIVTGVDTSDPNRPAVSWTSEGPIDASAATVSAQWASADYSNTWIWDALTPAIATTLRMPTVPEGLANARPSADATLVTAGVNVMQLDYVTGYDAVAAASSWAPEAANAEYTVRTAWASL